MKLVFARTTLFSFIILLKTTVCCSQVPQTSTHRQKWQNSVKNAIDINERELGSVESSPNQYKDLKDNCVLTMESVNGDCGMDSSKDNSLEIDNKYLRNSNEEEQTSSSATKASHVETSNALALVPFDESSVLPHQQRKRSFTFAGHEINIQQDWGGLGVAAVVWDAAVVLGEYLEQNRHIVDGKRVIELGSGTGLAGLVASFLGGHVTVTERQEALSFLQKTVEKNLPQNSSYKIDVAELDWTKPLDNFTDQYDVILGADIIYVKDTFDDLYRTLVHLASPDTLLLISCKIRYDRDTDFLDILKKDFGLKQDVYDKERDIYIYSVKKKI